MIKVRITLLFQPQKEKVSSVLKIQGIGNFADTFLDFRREFARGYRACNIRSLALTNKLDALRGECEPVFVRIQLNENG